MNEMTDFIKFKTEKLELINNILLSSCGNHPDLENKTISELMRIYYATIGSQCPCCGNELTVPIFNSIYRNNAS